MSRLRASESLAVQRVQIVKVRGVRVAYGPLKNGFSLRDMLQKF